MARRARVPLIPREVLFGNPDKASPRLSHDGARLSYVAPVNGVLNVWVGPADDPEAARPVTDDRSRGIRFHFWAYTNQHVIYIQDVNGDENWHVYRVDLNTNETLDLTPIQGVQALVQEVSYKHPHEIIVGLNDRDPRLHDLYRVSLDSGERRLIQQNTEGFSSFVTDDEYNVRFALKMTPDGGSEAFRRTEAGGWELFTKVGMEDSLSTYPMGFDKTRKVLYMYDSRGRNTSALTAINLDTGQETVLAEDPKADVGDVLIHPTEKNIQAAGFTYERKRWRVLDDAVGRDLEYLSTIADGEIEIASRTLDDRHWMVVYVMDNGPVRYYRYDRDARRAEFLFTTRKALEGAPLAKMHPVVIKARDGLDMVCYYTLPPQSGDGAIPNRRLPMVLFVHGGPWARDFWGYDPHHQWLANRGYAVLSVNYRGSTGFGKEFINAGNMEWGRKMHDDLIDAVQWAIAQGIADPRRIAIMGGSYGGYATLAGLTFTPDVFACGVDVVGPSNLVTLMETIPPYWEPIVAVFTTRVGDHKTEEGRTFLMQRSPLTYVDRISKPLLIGQGANDPRVKQSESDQIVRAMQEKGIPVTYVLYPDEGHGFLRPENNLSFNAISEAFLAQHLGGRFEPIGEDFKGSSITVPTGAEQIPGLIEALEEYEALREPTKVA
jgi:dipeptidyl aminopeptidase/acylaminoacyl peptidase